MMFLAVSEEVSGKQFVNIVTLFFQLAQALILDHEPKDAVQRMRDSYRIVFSLSSLVLTVGLRKRSRHGLNNSRTTLCRLSNMIVKHVKDLQTRRLRKVLPIFKVVMRTRPQSAVGQSSADMVHGRDSRST